MKQLPDSDKDRALQWGQNTTQSLWGSVGSKTPHRLMPQNPTTFIMAISTVFCSLAITVFPSEM